jgi:phage gp37-like protein
MKFYPKISQSILGHIAHNVPAVYDVWAGIKGLCAAKTARPNVPE